MKTKLSDVMVTFFGIGYIVFFLAFLPLLYGSDNGKYLIWYALIAAWGTDTCAYFVGSKFGKHKFSKISPKKSAEGCIRWNNRFSNNSFNIQFKPYNSDYNGDSYKTYIKDLKDLYRNKNNVVFPQ